MDIFSGVVLLSSVCEFSCFEWSWRRSYGWYLFCFFLYSFYSLVVSNTSFNMTGFFWFYLIFRNVSLFYLFVIFLIRNIIHTSDIYTIFGVLCVPFFFWAHSLSVHPKPSSVVDVGLPFLLPLKLLIYIFSVSLFSSCSNSSNLVRTFLVVSRSSYYQASRSKVSSGLVLLFPLTGDFTNILIVVLVLFSNLVDICSFPTQSILFFLGPFTSSILSWYSSNICTIILLMSQFCQYFPIFWCTLYQTFGDLQTFFRISLVHYLKFCSVYFLVLCNDFCFFFLYNMMFRE